MKQLNLEKQIMLKIKNHKVKMRPKGYFVAEKSLLIFVVILMVISAIIFINLTFHIVKNNGALEFLEFGREGWAAFWEGFPYGFIIWSVIFIGLAYLAFRQFDFSYRKPSYQFIIMILAIGVGGGLLLSSTKANDTLAEPVKKSNIPIFSHAYESAQPKVLNSGTFIKIDKVYDGYIVTKLPNGRTLIIKTNNDLGNNLNNVVVEGSKAETDFVNRIISENEKQFQELLAQRQAMIAKINQIQQEQLKKIQSMQYKSGQVLKIVGQRNGDTFEAVNIAPVNSTPKIFASEEN